MMIRTPMATTMPPTAVTMPISGEVGSIVGSTTGSPGTRVGVAARTATGLAATMATAATAIVVRATRAIRRDWPVDRVVAELRDAHRVTMELAARLPGDLWSKVGTIPWYGPEYSLDEMLVYTMYGHKREHGPQLEHVLSRPERGG